MVKLKTSHGDITLQIFTEKAPITVENFLQYVDRRHFDSTIFHRVIPNFMCQYAARARLPALVFSRVIETCI